MMRWQVLVSRTASFLQPRRCVSSPTSKTIPSIKQGGLLFLYVDRADRAKVEIEAAWQDHVDVDLGLIEPGAFSVLDDAESQTLTIDALKDAPRTEEPLTLKVRIPELFNIVIIAKSLDLTMKNKILGDVRISCKSGDIAVDKLRGFNLTFDCGEANVTVRKLLEGNTSIRANSLQAKMINGDSVDIITAAGADIEAIYSKYAKVESTKDTVAIGLMHGHIQAKSGGGDIVIRGLDGSFDISAGTGKVTLQLNKLGVNTKSRVQAVQGGIETTVDPELIASVECRSNVATATATAANDSVTIISDTFIRESESNTSNAIITNSTSNSTSSASNSARPVRGMFTGQSTAPSRRGGGGGGGATARGSGRGSSSGKIDLQGAKLQSLNTLLSQQQQLQNVPSDIATTSTATPAGDKGEQHSPLPQKNFLPADISFTAGTMIKLETLSWMEAIRRKHGFHSPSEGPPHPSKEGGRRATATAALKASKEKLTKNI